MVKESMCWLVGGFGGGEEGRRRRRRKGAAEIGVGSIGDFRVSILGLSHIMAIP